MSPKSGTHSAESDVVELNLNETELTLGLPGTKSASKRGLSESSSSINFPEPKAQMVGWPPVRASRKNMTMKKCKYVKVAVDGAPYLRKVDLETYESYDQLLRALETMFCCSTIRNDLNERKLMDTGNGGEYVPTFEDKDGDWMLVGDVPWKMFVESCKRIRLMIRSESEATGLDSRRDPKCRS